MHSYVDDENLPTRLITASFLCEKLKLAEWWGTSSVTSFWEPFTEAQSF